MKALIKPGSVLAVLMLLTSASASAQPPADLAGAWLLIGNDVQRSFCDGSSTQQPVVALVLVTQTGESVTMTIPGESELSGRASASFVAAEELSAEASTVLTGVVSPDGSRISGTLVFFDKHACPDAETGSTRFVLIRLG